METEHVPSPFAIAGGAAISIWFGIAIAGLGLVFTPVIDASAQDKKPASGSSSTKKKDEAKDAGPKKFEEGNLNAPFVTYVRGDEKSGSNWKAMVEGITSGKSPAKFTEVDLNSWFLSLPTKDNKEGSVVPERANFRVRENKLTVSAWINVSGTKVAFAAQGDFTGSNKQFKINSCRFGSCPLPGFLSGMLMNKFSPDTSKYKPILDLKEAWPKFKLVSVEGEVLNIIP